MTPVSFFGESTHWTTGHWTPSRIAAAVHVLLRTTTLPSRPDARILIKPNLNNDLSALTGNSTDLRVLAALVGELKKLGYSNLTIADGPNIGACRKGIDVFGRLGLRSLAGHIHVELLDLNHSPAVEVRVATGNVHVARACLEADCLISVPKIKTHAEAGISSSIKNLMGCVAGADKWLMHADLPANLVSLNKILRPHLILVDGLIAMEGNGPGDGSPRRLDWLLAGTDAFKLDLLVTRLIGMDWNNVPCLTTAYETGSIKEADILEAGKVDPAIQMVPAPPRRLITRLLDRRELKVLRDITRPIHRSESVRRTLHRAGIMQDVYENTDAGIQRLQMDKARCTNCGLCVDYCPLALPILATNFDFQKSACIKCLYCSDVCPEEAILTEGELGYLKRHRTRFAAKVRAAAQDSCESTRAKTQSSQS